MCCFYVHCGVKTIFWLFQVLAALSSSNVGFNLDPRLLRHFAVLRLRTPSSADLRNIIYSVLEANLSDKLLNQEVHDAISTASCKILELCKEVLRPWYDFEIFCRKTLIIM